MRQGAAQMHDPQRNAPQQEGTQIADSWFGAPKLDAKEEHF